MTPDLEYFLPFLNYGRFSHTIPGVFTFCLPLGLIALWIFHALLKLPLLSLLPGYQQRRLWPVAWGFAWGPPREFVVIVCSLIIGAFSHLMWDSFTHATGWVVKHVDFLSVVVLPLPYNSIRLYALLQYLSSVGGAAFLIFWYWRWLRLAPSAPLPSAVQEPLQLAPRIKMRLVAGMALGTTVLGIILGWHNTPAVAGILLIRRFVRYTVIAGISTTCIELLLFSLYWHLLRPPRRMDWRHK